MEWHAHVYMYVHYIAEFLSYASSVVVKNVNVLQRDCLNV